MSCKKCGSLRAGQGGLKLGGTVLPMMGAPCPCSFRPRIRNGIDFTLDQHYQYYFGPELWKWDSVAMFCTSGDGATVPSVVSVDVPNITDVPYLWSMYVLVANIALVDCNDFNPGFSYYIMYASNYDPIEIYDLIPGSGETNQWVITTEYSLLFVEPVAVTPEPVFKIQFNPSL